VFAWLPSTVEEGKGVKGAAGGSGVVGSSSSGCGEISGPEHKVSEDPKRIAHDGLKQIAPSSMATS
jgi:hypothetical protein